MNPIIIAGPSIDAIYPNLLRTLLRGGAMSSPRAQRTLEICPLVIHLEDALNNLITDPVRNLNYSFMVAEWFWIMAGRSDVASIAHYNKQIARFSDDGISYFGAYGPRLNAQRDYVIRKLKEDPDTRQAVMTIWRENPPTTRDVPCTIAAQFLLRDDKLNANFWMRSSDAWLGIPYDVFNFTRILSVFAAAIGVPTGALALTLGSSHLYEDHWDDAEELLAYRGETYVGLGRSPELHGVVTAAQFDLWEAGARRGQLTSGPAPWIDYIEALAYRNHRDLDRGDGHVMQLMRAVARQRQLDKETSPQGGAS